MNRKTYRTAILVFGLFTALVHLVLLNVLMGGISPIFTLNGLGYLALLWVFFRRPAFLIGRRALLHYVFIGYTAATLLAWVAIGDKSDPIGWITKASEVLLIVALALNLRVGNQA